MSIPIPSGMTRGRVSWRIGHDRAGSTLPGASGTVRFEPTARAVSYTDATVLPEPVETPVIGGVMTPVDLQVNDPDIWNWKVQPRVGVAWEPFHVDVPGPVDLATAVVVPGVGPVRAVKGAKGDTPTWGDLQGEVLGTENLDTVTASGLYRQPVNANATLARNYPIAGVAGTLWVEHRSAGVAVQTFTPLGAAPYRQYVRTNGIGWWQPWEGVETTGSKAGPELGTSHLDSYTATGVYRQIQNGYATIERGYPVAGVGGTLLVQNRSGNVASQIFTPLGKAPHRLYWRSNWDGTWGTWEGVETASSRGGPELGSANLDTVTATGTYRQPVGNLATTANGYPAGATGGALQVIARDSAVAAQIYWSIGQALDAQAHFRVATSGGSWSAWRPLGGSSSGGGGGGASESDLLAGYEAALEVL